MPAAEYQKSLRAWNEADALAAQAARYRSESESLTGGTGPGPRLTPTTHVEVCFPNGNPIGVRIPAEQPHVRTVLEPEFVEFLRDINCNGVETVTPKNYKGVWYRNSFDEIIGVRFSSNYGLTVDVIRSNNPLVPRNFTVHYK
jgi:filamentous hemagglutinin